MRRIWSEALPPDDLAGPATLRLLAKYGLQPIIALPPDREAPGMARALAEISRAGLRLVPDSPVPGRVADTDA